MSFRRDLFVQWREEAGLSQRKLAVKLGVSNQTISAWEKGTNQPSIEHLDEIHLLAKGTPGYGNALFYDPNLPCPKKSKVG